MERMKKVSVVIPVYYNEDSLQLLFERLKDVENKLFDKGVELELIFVDDGSKDDSLRELLKIKKERTATKVIKLTRNFGEMSASRTGIKFATGDCMSILAADLQDPPELIPQMVDKWIAGSKYIICARRKRNDPLIGKLFSRLYYFLVRFFVMKNYPIGGYDLALMDGILMKHIAESGKNVHTPLYAYWLGIEPEIIYYDREKRRHGKSRWNLGKKIKAFLDSLLSFSYVPIRFMSAIGIVTSLASLIFGIYIIIDYLLHGANGVRGFATIATLLSFLFGLVFFMLGVIGEYIWRIYDEISKRPETVIEEIF